MRVCDRHPRSKATDTVHIASHDAYFDLCEQCTNEIMRFISKPKAVVTMKKGNGILGRTKDSV